MNLMRHVEFQHDAFYCIYNIFNYPFIPILVYSFPLPQFYYIHIYYVIYTYYIIKMLWY